MNDQCLPSGRITRIEQQKRSKKRYSIYINEEYAFSIHEDVLVSCSLHKDKLISEWELAALLKEEERKKVVRSGLHYLGYRARTIQEMRLFLQNKEYQTEYIEEAIQQWKKTGLLNDRQFAQQWVDSRVRRKGKGAFLIKEELKRKGIPSQMIDEVMAEIDDQEEYAACLAVAQKKWPSYAGEEEQKAKQKLYHFLLRRGYSSNLILSVYKQLKEEKQE